MVENCTLSHVATYMSRINGMYTSFSNLAGRIGVSKSQYIRYETNDVQPPADKLNNLAEALETTVDYLINGAKTLYVLYRAVSTELSY